MQACRRWLHRTAYYQLLHIADQAPHRPVSTTADGILAEYHRQLAAGKLHADSTQLVAVQALQLLQDGLAITAASRAAAESAQQAAAATAAAAAIDDTKGQPQTETSSKDDAEATAAATVGRDSNPNTDGGSSSGSSSSPNASSVGRKQPLVQGTYLWGPVGSGKTMLMDMFLRTLPTSVTPPDSSSSSSNAADEGGASTGSSQPVELVAHRIHYHEFMLAVHERLHQLQESLPKVVTYSRAGLPVYRYALPPEDPLLVIARQAAAGLHLLCLDELHVTDVADAMLLSRLFGEVLRQGCMLIFTSNRPARDLYKGGLSRKYFEPFIQLIDERMLQLKVAGGRDYRMQLAQQQGMIAQQAQSPHSQQQEVKGLHQQQHGMLTIDAAVAAGAGAWLVGPAAEQQLQQQWQQLAQQLADAHAAVVTGTPPPTAPEHAAAAAAASLGSDDGMGQPASIQLPFGRSLWIPKALPAPPSTAQQQQQQQLPPHLAAAWFTFDQLCSNSGSRQSLEHAGALSSNDFVALAKGCSALFISGLPQLAPQRRDDARRLVTLIDILYEVHTMQPGRLKLFVTGEVAPGEVFLPLLGAAAAQGVNPNLGKAAGKLDVKQLVKDYGSQPLAPAAGRDYVGAAAGESDGQRSAAAAAAAAAAAPAAELRSPLLPEEVLMYHRASSRLVELCALVHCP